MDAAHRARESGLGACRSVIRASASAIRAVHLGQHDLAAARRDDARVALTHARDALAPHPAIYHAGFLHDAAKEYVEACATAALVAGDAVPPPEELGVEPAAWLVGLAEAASELRRNCLDRLREGDLPRAEVLLARMDEVFAALIVIDLPDAVTGGLRRTLDALRAVIERTRGDVTSATVAHRLQRSLEGRIADR